ncbi:MAG: CNNM domain-containing protein [Verrucomicrobiota bacterium]
MMDIAIIFFCCIVSFLFTGIEAGLLSINSVRLRHHVKQNVPGAVRLNRLLQNPERLFVTVLLITNMADILGLLLLTRRLVWNFGHIGFAAALLIAFPVYLFLLAVFPTALFRRFPFRALVPFAGLLELVSFVLWPLLELGGRLGQLILPGRERGQARLFAAREELKQLTTESEREGSITATERAMIHNVVDFRGVKVRDVMVPLNKIVSVRPETTVDEALKRSCEAGVDRLPVIAHDGKALGLINTLDILLEASRARPLSQQMRRIVTTTEEEPAYRAMQRLRAARLGLAGVLDRENNLSGVVTIEDLIRRLVQSA